MFLELIALFLGISAGIITGLTPGVHINLVSLLVLQFAPLLFIVQFFYFKMTHPVRSYHIDQFILKSLIYLY